jgi:hypothetical protein
MTKLKLLAFALFAATLCEAFPHPGQLVMNIEKVHDASMLKACKDFDCPKWIPASTTAKRSPCPALNTLANHGYLWRNGSGISADDLVQATESVYRLSPFVGSKLASVAINGLAPNTGRLDLDQLQKHGFIEHDASLTRNDTDLPGSNNNWEVAPDLVLQLLSFADSTGRITMKALASARHLREMQSNRENPEFSFGLKEKFIAYAEAALLWEYLSDPQSKSLSSTQLREFFLLERIPANVTATQPITLPRLLTTMLKIFSM